MAHLSMENSAKSRRSNTSHENDYDTVDQAFTRSGPSQGFEQVDIGFTREQQNKAQHKRADFFDFIIAVVAIITYIADVGTDILSAQQYYAKRQWTWFAPTVCLIVIPSLVLQLFSSKWYRDDDGCKEEGEEKQSVCSKLLHYFQLSAVERYIYAFWYGAKTWITPDPKEKDYQLYLSNWRDVTFLRLLECYLESAPQVVLQLYVLSTIGRTITVREDYIIISQITLSIGSIGWSVVSYSHASRLSLKQKGFSLCGYTSQVVYRLSMISSRIAALTLFTTEYGWVVVPITFIHWLAMVTWISYEGWNFCEHSKDWVKKLLDKFFALVVGAIYVFCFMNMKEGMTRNRVTIYYIVFFIENSLLIAAWYPTRKQIGILEIGAIVFTWGGFLIGIFSMIAYYKYFHPNQDIGEGWCTCCSTDKDTIKDETASAGDISHETYGNALDVVPRYSKRDSNYQRSLSVDIEFPPKRLSPLASKRISSNTLNDSRTTTSENYGASSESTMEIHTGESEKIFLVKDSSENGFYSYKVSITPSRSFDKSGLVSQFFV